MRAVRDAALLPVPAPIWESGWLEVLPISFTAEDVGVRGVSWSEVATVPKRKSHRGLDLNLSWNSEEDIWKGWKKSGGTK